MPAKRKPRALVNTSAATDASLALLAVPAALTGLLAGWLVPGAGPLVTIATFTCLLAWTFTAAHGEL